MNVITTGTGTLDDIDEQLGRRLQDLAREEGPDSALAALHGLAGDGVLVCCPTGYVLAPRGLAKEASRLWTPSGIVERTLETETDLTTWVLEALGLVAFRYTGPGCRADPDRYRPFVLALGWLRLGLSGRLLDASFAHLGGRKVGTEPLLRQQLVKGSLADVVIDQLDAETTLVNQTAKAAAAADATGAVLVELHALVTRTDRILQRLLGAKGFAVEGPGQIANVSELLVDAYISSDSGAVA